MAVWSYGRMVCRVAASGPRGAVRACGATKVAFGDAEGVLASTALPRFDGAARHLSAAMAALTLAMLLAPLARAAEPGPDTHLFRAELPDRGMVVFLPESDIDSKEAAAAYLRWSRESHPAWANRLRGVWASDTVALPVLYGEAALLRKGDSAVDPSGAIGFRVEELPKNGRFGIRLESLPERGEATPCLCLTNVWVLSRDELFARWLKELDARTDEAQAKVRGQIEILSTSGRYARSGGATWEAAVEDFRTNTPSLWPRVRFENRTEVPVLVWFQSATNRIAPGGTWRVSVTSPPESGEVRWFARRVPAAPYLEQDYEYEKGETRWSPLASADAVHFFQQPPGRLKSPPAIQLMFTDSTQPMPEGLFASIKYKDGEAEEIKAFVTNGLPAILVRPHVALSEISLKADGYEDTAWYRWKEGDEPNLGCGEIRKLKFPSMPKPRKPAAPSDAPQARTAPQGPAAATRQPPRPSDHQTTRPPDHPTTRPSDTPPARTAPQGPDAAARQTTVPSDHETKPHSISPWPGVADGQGVPEWPWRDEARKQNKVRGYWDDYNEFERLRPGKDDFDRKRILDSFCRRLEDADGDIGRAYRHIASCPGCDRCRAHRADVMRVGGFEEQRWALFRSLLMSPDVDWINFSSPPNEGRIGSFANCWPREWRSENERRRI